MSDAVTNPNISHELARRVAAAAKVMAVEAHAVWDWLGKLGIREDEDSLKMLDSNAARFDDAISSAPPGVPIIPLRAAWSVLKGQGQTLECSAENGVAKLVEAMRPIGQYSDDELLAKYGPDASSEIFDELSKRCHGRAFIVFGDDNKVNAEVTKKLLGIARRGETPPTYPVATGKIARVCHVGEFPMLFVEECPIHRHVVLADGYCHECGGDWSAVQNSGRVMVRVAVDIGRIKPDDGASYSPETLAERAVRDPKAKLAYDELHDDGKLPLLSHRMSSGKHGDPFYVRS